MNGAVWLGPAFAGLLVSQPSELRWEFDGAGDVTSAHNLAGATVADGRLQGLTTWDPYVYLRLPEEGIEASDYRSLQVRLFSSAPADLLDIYYKTAKEYWCLGGSLPIAAGWAVYSVDLSANKWRETHWPEARKWGGPDGQIVSFRVDPGNQADRWVMVDWVRLTGEALPTELKLEPRLKAKLLRADCPERVVAGQPVAVRLLFDVTSADEVAQATAYARLEGSGVILAHAEREVELLEQGRVEVSFELPTLPRLAASATLRAGIYEALDPERTASDEIARVDITSATRKKPDFPRCEVRQLGDSPAVFVDGRPVPLFCFCARDPNAEFDASKQPRSAQMHRAGIRILSNWFGRSHDGFLGRTGPDEYDYAEFDLYFARALQNAPDALFLPHVYVTAPVWWQEAHPEEMCGYHDGGTGPQSFASELWRDEIGDDLVRLIRHLREAPYADRIIGLVICSGYSAEWQSWGLWQNKFVDYSGPGVEAWREWLTERYGTDAALREAWRQADVSLTTATPPAAERRTASSYLMLRDPVGDRDILDYLTFLNELTADSILHFARLAKQASAARLLIGTYYGYLTQHHFHQAESSHCGIESVLASPDIDFLMSPPLYTERSIGEVSGFMSVTDSVHRHGKIWVSEADYRTHQTDPAAGYGRTATLDETLNVLWREFAHVLCKRAGVSWYDMGDGWLSGPDIPPELGRMNRIMADYLAERTPYQAEVAVFIDPHSFYYVKPDPRLCQYLTLYPIVNLHRAGAPFDLYVLSDLWEGDLRDYKLYVFLNAYALDRDARQEILKRTRKAGTAALWHWAAGYVWPDGNRRATPQEMSELVGVRLEAVEGAEPRRLSASAAAEPYARRLAETEEADNPLVPIGPAFLSQEGDVLAQLEPGGAPGLVKQRVGKATAFYSALPSLPPGILRQVYLDAGVHVYLDADDCLYFDGHWLAFHASGAGARTLRFPGPVKCESVRSGVEYSGSEVTLKPSEHATELLRISR